MLPHGVIYTAIRCPRAERGRTVSRLRHNTLWCRSGGWDVRLLSIITWNDPASAQYTTDLSPFLVSLANLSLLVMCLTPS
jgi:hypothetical protein